MLYLIFFVVCFGASVVGAICGISGGVIIKPVLDSFGILDVSAISFLSGCTVLAMTTYSVVHNKLDGESKLKRKTSLPLALGAAAGGVAGKWLFLYIKSQFADANRVGAVQAVCLLVVTSGILVYTIFKDKVKTYHVEHAGVCVLIGVFLGVLSSFLGIGGGVINLAVLFYFFSMPTKVAAENSLYIIFFSQLASLLSTLLSGTVPTYQSGVLILMVIGGITGGVCGRAINKKIETKSVDQLFIVLMIVMIMINASNVYRFMQA